MNSPVPHPAERFSPEPLSALRLRVSLLAGRPQVLPVDLPSPNLPSAIPDGFTAVRPRQKAKLVKSDDGRVTIKYWRSRWRDKKRRRIYTKWFFIQPDGRRQSHASETLTLSRAKEVANDIANGRVALLSFTHEDKASYQRSLELARSAGLPLELLVARAAEALAILRSAIPDVPPDVLALAARDYVLTHHASRITKTCPQLLEEMLRLRKQDGASQNTLDDYQSRLGRFVKDFTCPITALTTKAAEDWLCKLDISRRTRNNYRGNLVDLETFAKRRGYVPKTFSVFTDLPRLKNEPVTIKIFTPREIEDLLAARMNLEAQHLKKHPMHPLKTLVPYIAISAWGACRHEELSATDGPDGRPLPVLDWREVDFDTEEIRVLPEVARKIGHDRIVPMQPNLVDWLRPYRPDPQEGPVCALRNATNALLRAARDAGIPWKDNGLRKSFISYRLAETHNIGQVADEAGTSPDRIRHNYKKTVRPDLAKKWFSIYPTQAAVRQLKLALS